MNTATRTSSRTGSSTSTSSPRTVSRSSPTNGTKRRTKADIKGIRDAMHDLIQAEKPMTVRQVFYRLSTQSIVRKTENEYNATVCRLLTRMRLDGDLPFHWIADNTRWMRKPDTYRGLEEVLHDTARFYRRDLWQNQDAYVEVWLEKEALAGVLVDVTAEYDVPLMVTRGYSSLSFLHSAGEAIASIDKPVFIYYFGDHDPSGVDIPRTVEKRLREFAPDADISFEVVAVTPEQIKAMDLPTRPTKKTDTRSASFEGESVEVDAIPPNTLRDLCRRCIEQHIDHDALNALKVAEESERDYLRTLADKFDDEGGAG